MVSRNSRGALCWDAGQQTRGVPIRLCDVAVSDLQVTHTTKKGAKTYGRLEGEVYGRYLMPPPGELDDEEFVPEAELSERPLSEEEKLVAAGTEKPLVEERRHRPPAPITEEADGRTMEALHPPTPPRDRDERDPSHIPIPFLIVVMAVVLGLAGGWEPALLWLAAFVPIQIIRLILTGLFKVTDGQRVFGAVLVVVQVACLGLILLDWWSAGCKTINVWAVSGIGVTALVASVLPSTLPLLCAGGSLGLVLFLWYADVGVKCEGSEPKKPKVESPAGRPTVHDPGVPRTNADGSWPRRPPRTR
ncbi:MAG: chromate transporter [Myxococcales bacterium]|nr:chromate transporter [Myxococcales bacterium]